MVAEYYIDRFESLGFGMFVHFGLYSLLGKGEWVAAGEEIISREEYARLIHQFDVKRGFFKELVSVAKKAGCKYMILTARHHDGFSLYDTKGLSDFDVMHSPTRRDLVKEFANECRKADIIPFFYHTGLDWSRQEYKQNFSAYLTYLRESIRLLCTNYGDVGGFWFDGFWGQEDWELEKLFAVVREYRPNAVIVFNRGLLKSERQNGEIDCLTFERDNPRKEKETDGCRHRAREMCQVTNDHWGYAVSDLNYKSVRSLLENLVFCRKFRSNFVLNVGAHLEQVVTLQDRAIFDVIGRWLSVFGESIFEAKPTEIETDNGKDFILRGKEGYFLFVHDLTSSGDIHVVAENGISKQVRIKNFPEKIKDIVWLDTGTDLSYRQDGKDYVLACEQFSYSRNLIIRVARITTE